MKVFLSWSGELSHQLAIVLKDWLPSVIQVVEPFLSSEDIDKGTRWNVVLSEELEATSIGLICVTRQNLNSSWMNFEAGALAKHLDNSRVMPLLLGVKKSEVKGPLSQFQLSTCYEAELRRIVYSINQASTSAPLTEALLERSFSQWWPTLEAMLEPLIAAAEQLTDASPRQTRANQDSILEELLELARGQQRVLENMERGTQDVSLDKGYHVSSQAIEDLQVRWSAVALTAMGLTEGDRKSYRALFEYLEPGITCVLQETSSWDTLRSTDRYQRREVGEMYKGPPYRIISRPIGNDIIALREYGGGAGDPVAAWVRVDGSVVLQVVAPEIRSEWSTAMEENFRNAVRELAAEHDLLGRTGSVTVLFDPTQAGVDDGSSGLGESIERT